MYLIYIYFFLLYGMIELSRIVYFFVVYFRVSKKSSLEFLALRFVFTDS